MSSNRYDTLGGEGWPAADIAGHAENRNNYAVLTSGVPQVCAASGRSKQEQTGTADTNSAQQTGFAFQQCSRSWAAFWRYVIERNPPCVFNAMPEFVPQTWAGMKRDCGR